MMPMELAYVGVVSEDLQAWSEFASRILRVPDEQTERGAVYLRTDTRRFRVAIETPERTPGQHGGLAYVGWQVRDEDERERFAHRLEDIGAVVEPMDPDDLEDRGSSGGVRIQDPDGYAVELVDAGSHVLHVPEEHLPGMRFDQPPYDLGHVVLAVADLQRSLNFYTRGLGLRLTDIFDHRIAFLHCNSRHHSLALVQHAETGLRHLMLETPMLRDLGILYDRCVKEGIATRGLGQHVNDEAVSFYCRTPSGIQLELAHDSLRIDPATWTTRLLDGPMSFWGHPHL